MKKLLPIFGFLLLTGPVFGQQAIDYLFKAMALKKAGKTELSKNLLNEGINKVKDIRLYSERAEVNISEGDYSDAISDYNEANKTDPSSGEYGLARIYAIKGDAGTALYHLEMNLRSPFKRSEKEIMLDAAFNSIESRTEWRQFWKKEWYTDSERTISELEYYTSAGKVDMSSELLADLKKNNRNNEEIIYAQSLISLSYGKYTEAVKSISGLVSLHPENEKYLMILAKAQTGISNPSGASVTYTQLLSTVSADPELLILRADCYRKTGETEKSLADINEYLDIFPENKSALSLAGRVEAASGNSIKALEYFSHNLKLHPNDPDCFTDRASIYFTSRSWSWAIEDYSMSLDLKPGNSDAWLNKGISLLNLGNVSDACHDFQKSLSLGNKRATEYFSNNCIK